MPVVDYGPPPSTKRSTDDNGKVDPNDPRVKKLVYSMYRDMLTNCNENATNFINQKHPSQVTQDKGIGPILQSLITQGNSEGGSSNPPQANSTGSMPPPPPPPPMVQHGSIPAVRLNTEIGPRDKGPPMALAGAMMKDKKPFTYTPGGIDLSEIRSPRMAKRLQMNAAAEGVTSAPESRAAQGGVNSAPAHHISPSAYAAMQPQMAIPVFPQGGFNSNQLTRTPKPSDFTSENGATRPSHSNGGAPPPPPPPQFMMHQQQQSHPQSGGLAASTARSPPPPPERGSGPLSSQHYTANNDSRPGSNLSNISSSGGYFGGGDEERISSPVGRSSPAPANMGTGAIYIPPLSPPMLQPSSPTPRVASPVRQTKAQAASQHLGSIYIPPIDNNSNRQVGYSGGGTPGTANTASSGGTPASPGPAPQSAKSSPPTALPTPQLNKAPTPWMNSYNRIATKQAESPPYVNPAHTPWGNLSGPPTPQGQGVGVVRTIPISIVRDDNSTSMGYSNNNETSPSVNIGRPPMGYEQRATAAQHLGRVIPIQIQRQESNSQQQIQQQMQQQHMQEQIQQQQMQQQMQQQQQQHQKPQNQRWGTNLPVQVDLGRHPVGGPPPTIRRVVGPAGGYNNPMGLYSNQNATDAYQQQTGELASGINNMSVGESPRMEPTQSKSMRLIQKVAENVDDNGSPQGHKTPTTTKTTEPRFRGAHIPSKAFKALQTTLPPSSPDSNQSTQNYPQGGGGPVTHNIQIRMNPQSSTPQQQQQQQQSRLPASEQQTPEPRKYMGSNIPSRSFKMLQAMTAEDDPSALDSSASSPPAALNTSLNNCPQSPSSISLASSDGCSTVSTDLSLTPTSDAPSWGDDPTYDYDPNDPYSYMSWHYWWYYVSYYWAGYDMTGYEYPEGWDPNNPYFPPEFYNSADYPNNEEYEYVNDPKGSVPENNDPELKPLVNGHVPKIVVVDGDTILKEGLKDCDSVRESDEESYWSCAEESDKVIETPETAEIVNNHKDEHIDELIDMGKPIDKQYDDEEETEPEDAGYEGIVEEPETPTSEDSDATIIDENNSSKNISIEEYISSSESSEVESHRNLPKNKLSTIDEITERSRTSSSLTITNNNDWSDWDSVGKEDDVAEIDKLHQILESEDSSDSSSSSDEMSSVSVIENKSDGTRGTESKREDETSTDSNTEDEDDTDEDLDGDNTAVTVRLPLKLSFGKTKSYKDITTLMVMDEELRADEPILPLEPQALPVAKKEVTFQVDKVKEIENVTQNDDEYEEDDEPVVSYTISLSRQPSREDEPCSDESPISDQPEIDFWGQIIPSTTEEVMISHENEAEEFGTVNDYWDVSDTKYTIKKAEDEGQVEKKFNFWDKSLKSIETRRFSNFEISEDYESDSGMRSDTGPSSGGKVSKVKVKRYSHTQKRHSVPGLPQWNRLTLTSSDSKPKQNSDGKPKPHVEILCSKPEAEKNSNSEKETGDLSSGWSFWDEMELQNRSPELKLSSRTAKIIQNQKEEELSDEEYGNDTEVSIEIKLPLPTKKTSPNSPEMLQNSTDFSEEYEEESEKEDEGLKYLNDGSNNMEDVSQFEPEAPSITDMPSVTEPHTDTELRLPVSDETSDESSSKSSGATTIATPSTKQPYDEEVNDIREASLNIPRSAANIEEEKDFETFPNIQTKSIKESDLQEISEERSIKIKELGQNIKLIGNEEDHEEGSERCTCHLGNRMAKAESLLWRIERFLHESLSLGSEDDSGVMTDLSRQISDVDTDADNDQNDTEFILTAAAAAKDRRTQHSHNGNCKASANGGPMSPKSPDVVRRRPQSEILLETSSKFVEEIQKTTTNGVKMRTTSAEKKALRYQRAKTHSRLFQLLQDECGKEEEDEDEEDDEDEVNYTEIRRETVTNTTVETITTAEDTSSGDSIDHSKRMSAATKPMSPINVDTSDLSVRRSRLLPLPLKNILGSSFDSNSSPSGSSGVLSPTSPVTRDQLLLADIINEFQLRHQDSKISILQSRRRFSRFPSKIFKLLQDEFGQEFYQTFECDDTLLGTRGSDPSHLNSNQVKTATATTTTANSTANLVVQECTIHKSDSLKAMEEARDRQQSTPDFLEVPLRKKPKSFTRDFRSPKTKNS